MKIKSTPYRTVGKIYDFKYSVGNTIFKNSLRVFYLFQKTG